jgi:twitching motility protein PilT
VTPDDPIRQPVYTVGNRKVSIYDLLTRFTDKQYQIDGIWRLSDLHLKVGHPVRYRFDNDLITVPEATEITREVLDRLVHPLLGAAQVEALERDERIDLDTSYELLDLGLAFRINVFRDRDGLACAIRVLPKTIPDVRAIGFPSEETWKTIADMRQGLVIVTGITGSGKSTTVASLLQHINRTRRVRVITVEDPVEYVLPGDQALISQREVGRHVTSFRQGLRSALREDPDIVFVGEMRDRETTAMALSAAETGHLVFSTLHTKDSRGAITRIVDMFDKDRAGEVSTQLSFSLSWVLAQKLVPRQGGAGRVVAMEVLRNIPATGNLIRSGKWHQLYSTIEANRKDGLITLERRLYELVQRDEITQEDAIRYANEPTVLHSWW